MEVPGSGVQVTVDTTAPKSEIDDPLNGATITGATIEVYGTAFESGSGISEVEVSFDGGNSWVVAQGNTLFYCSYPVTSSGQYTIKSRAHDLAQNVEVPGPGITVTVNYQVRMGANSSGASDEFDLDTNDFEAQKTLQHGPYLTLNLCTGRILTTVPITGWKCMGDLSVDLKMYRTDAYGWQNTYYMNLTHDDVFGTTLNYADGSVQEWDASNNGIDGNYDKLELAPSPSTGYIITRKNGVQYVFTSVVGHNPWNNAPIWGLSSIKQLTGEQITFSYDSKNRLEWIIDPATTVTNGKPSKAGRWLWFTYDDTHNGRLYGIYSSQYFGATAYRPQLWWFKSRFK